MNKVKIFVITDNSKFFYNINKILTELKIDFKIIGINDKIPRIPSIILSTFEELELLDSKIDRSRIIILPYNKQDNFNKYIFNFTKIYYCGKETYSNVLFSIDPGNTIGLAIFLDGHYFYSKSIYEEKILFSDIKQCIENLMENNKYPLNIIFKFGIGVFNQTKVLISKIYSIYNKKKNIKVYLVDESKSSKFKFHKLSKNISKHEASAIILALRRGIEVDQENYSNYFNLRKSNKDVKKKIEAELDNISYLERHIELLKSLFKEMISYKITINDALVIIKERKILEIMNE
ncbi:MAG: hypothetical protein JXA99_14535 [Candidatus Lokiarchaeota archaeon]|nr:hypothetical protein [Candidatus Lokiarchaeota archaeon]